MKFGWNCKIILEYYCVITPFVFQSRNNSLVTFITSKFIFIINKLT